MRSGRWNACMQVGAGGSRLGSGDLNLQICVQGLSWYLANIFFRANLWQSKGVVPERIRSIRVFGSRKKSRLSCLKAAAWMASTSKGSWSGLMSISWWLGQRCTKQQQTNKHQPQAHIWWPILQTPFPPVRTVDAEQPPQAPGQKYVSQCNIRNRKSKFRQSLENKSWMNKEEEHVSRIGVTDTKCLHQPFLQETHRHHHYHGLCLMFRAIFLCQIRFSYVWYELRLHSLKYWCLPHILLCKERLWQQKEALVTDMSHFHPDALCICPFFWISWTWQHLHITLD